ncbi:MAG: SGNH/GDSL hydrolase family protein [Verrucomicrobia bacterium]|nr:SGNH/GDSL hydrolase family protein [Verrucomicrobiota bacterium]
MGQRLLHDQTMTRPSNPKLFMLKTFLTMLAVAGLFTACQATPPNYPPSSREYIEWCDVWISHATETNLPRVLLIGDSITRAYYPEVEKKLEGRACVGRLATSAFISDPVLEQQLAMVLSQYQFDVIHFNNGMHGWQHSEAEYEAAFPKMLQTIKKYAPKAKLIWANTTPLKVSPSLPADNHADATDARVAARNTIAAKIVSAQGIPIDDLFTLALGHPEYHSDNIHFNDRGIALQANQVASIIEKSLH